jgi:DNA-binding transcriptional ArsR family regulator
MNYTSSELDTDTDLDTTGELDTNIELMIFRARVLSNPTRVSIWTCVGPLGMYVTEIANTIGVAVSTTSYHLSILQHAGLVTLTRQGRNRLVKWTDVKMGVVTEDEVRAVFTPVGLEGSSAEAHS